MDKLGKILPRVLARQRRSGRLVEATIRLRFREVLGEVASGCETVELVGSTLVVVTGNPALAHQLRLDGELLIARLNAASPTPKVKELKVRTGRGRARA